MFFLPPKIKTWTCFVGKCTSTMKRLGRDYFNVYFKPKTSKNLICSSSATCDVCIPILAASISDFAQPLHVRNYRSTRSFIEFVENKCLAEFVENKCLATVNTQLIHIIVPMIRKKKRRWPKALRPLAWEWSPKTLKKQPSGRQKMTRKWVHILSHTHRVFSASLCLKSLFIMANLRK